MDPCSHWESGDHCSSRTFAQIRKVSGSRRCGSRCHARVWGVSSECVWQRSVCVSNWWSSPCCVRWLSCAPVGAWMRRASSSSCSSSCGRRRVGEGVGPLVDSLEGAAGLGADGEHGADRRLGVLPLRLVQRPDASTRLAISFAYSRSSALRRKSIATCLPAGG
jgi:hypothetical protein